MIELTRLDKRRVSLNPDLIKSVEAIPDTIVTLINGERLYVLERVSEVRRCFVAYQRAIREAHETGAFVGAAPDVDDHVAAAPAPEHVL